MDIYYGSSAGQSAISVRDLIPNYGGGNVGIGTRQCTEVKHIKTKWRWSDYYPLFVAYLIGGILAIILVLIKHEIIPWWSLFVFVVPSIRALFFSKEKDCEVE